MEKFVFRYRGTFKFVQHTEKLEWNMSNLVRVTSRRSEGRTHWRVPSKGSSLPVKLTTILALYGIIHRPLCADIRMTSPY
jgi:hypothetical protein